MVNIIVELSKYLLVILIILYTFQCFNVFSKKQERTKKRLMRKQLVLIVLMDTVAFLVIYLKTNEPASILFYGEIMVYLLAIQGLYRLFYKKASMLLVNNMCMLLNIGFIIIYRLDIEKANRQFLIVAAGSAVALIVPVLIRKMKFLVKLTWLYAAVGMLGLMAVLVLAQVTGGAKLSIFGFQPSEFIKIVFVFFLAAALQQEPDFGRVCKVTVVAAVHVLVLVLSRDLGSALVFFITYLVMVYVATKKPLYFFGGLLGLSAASVVAYFLFGHVRQRVVAWKDPFAVYDQEGYQIVQSMFAIGTGSWFGMGLYQGSPKSIPVVQEDFVFSAICEELGGVFAICMILICMSFFLMLVNISLQIKNPFYKLIALGLGTEYAFQVFLHIGGATKFIPMTGITLPLVSYGGSSALSTIIMLGIIQGLYILREDEDEELEQIRKARKETGQIRSQTGKGS
ncbi:MAG: FtsW/RodA/SpoVE family cell cycle protein [Lachnospiraceae bacterium]|nr:FtsW/RodA/SpoVE family cell cycle protein [Lachnospiraceae bacterium]MDD6618278.1 FtsW/RodA/SpoVE family cell cycle protein [Clostridiales bacterium]MDY4769645.1 FtsW/RodA/SpoVE family cell cycle protein [Lachnospiraceae bacterium]